mmetsp:Transcript_27834/g.50329  ORF Transcript_27834/g.50329 Transcript_27834/m.50329 type:complete len:629 (+) Transcript_27834:200-2086(+)
MMMDNLRRLDDPSNTMDTMLSLPLSDFPNSNNTIAATTTTATAKTNSESNNETTQVEDEDDLILISLPPSNNNGGLTMDDLIRGESVYILGDTSEKDLNNTTIPVDEREEKVGVCGSIEPVAARLIVEGKLSINGCTTGKTMELTRVETSNTYIVVPPMPRKKLDGIDIDDGSSKRQKMDSSSTKDVKQMVTMPARSIGLVPGEDSPSCFFLDPLHLKAGHFGSKLRGTLSRWMYDPFDPPVESVGKESMDHEGKEEVGVNSFGYTVSELAYICRTSLSEIEYAIHNRVYGADDALAIPSSNKTSSTRYGMLSEEGRQTVAMAIVSVLLESDLELVWKFSAPSMKGKEQGKGMQLALLMEEIRSHWLRLEGGETSSLRAPPPVANPYLTNSQTKAQSLDETQSQFGTPSQFSTVSTASTPLQLADEVIWHCLRPILHYSGTSTNDAMPEQVHLLPDEVAKLAAHHVFLRGTPRSSPASSQTIGTGSAVCWEEEELMEAWSMRLPSMSCRYEPRMELLQGIAISEKRVDADDAQDTHQNRHWQYLPEAGLPLVPSLRMKSMFAMRDVWTLEEVVPYLEKFIVDSNEGDGKGLQSMVANLLGKYAKAINMTEKGGNGKDVLVTKYVTMPN